MAGSINRVPYKSLEFDRRAGSQENDTWEKKTIPPISRKWCFAWDVSKKVPNLSPTGSPL